MLREDFKKLAAQLMSEFDFVECGSSAIERQVQVGLKIQLYRVLPVLPGHVRFHFPFLFLIIIYFIFLI
jgi:hypothetical protein